MITDAERAMMTRILGNAQGKTLRKGPGKTIYNRALQLFLRDQGADIRADGVFGPKTQAALKDWQGKAGITSDGKAGYGTFQKVRSTLSVPIPTLRPDRPGDVATEPTPDEMASAVAQVKMPPSVPPSSNGLDYPNTYMPPPSPPTTGAETNDVIGVNGVDTPTYVSRGAPTPAPPAGPDFGEAADYVPANAQQQSLYKPTGDAAFARRPDLEWNQNPQTLSEAALLDNRNAAKRATLLPTGPASTPDFHGETSSFSPGDGLDALRAALIGKVNNRNSPPQVASADPLIQALMMGAR